MPEVTAYATASATSPFEKTTIMRREPGPTEVFFDILYAGICHSDIHTARGEWGPALYPLVPGHELAGIVRRVGSDVTDWAVGDRVGVGCFVDSCRACEYCARDQEQFCTGEGGTVLAQDIGIGVSRHRNRHVSRHRHGPACSGCRSVAWSSPPSCRVSPKPR